MAYCVHCGVKLGEAEEKCPLCNTERCDPKEPFDESVPKPYPVRTPEQSLRINRRYAVGLLSALLLIPAGLCLLFDGINGGITWSVYPAGVLLLIWIAIAVPLLMRKHRLYSTILITGTTLAAYLYMLESLSGVHGWFLPIVLPSLAAAIAMLCFTVWLIRSKRVRILHIEAVILVEIGLLCGMVEALIIQSGHAVHYTWSLFVIMPCFFLALLLYIVSRNGALSSELKRRFHL